MNEKYKAEVARLIRQMQERAIDLRASVQVCGPNEGEYNTQTSYMLERAIAVIDTITTGLETYDKGFADAQRAIADHLAKRS